MAQKKNWPEKNWPKYRPAAFASPRCMQKNENIGKNIFLVLYNMFRALISTIPQ
jgi:hypothetical protein